MAASKASVFTTGASAVSLSPVLIAASKVLLAVFSAVTAAFSVVWSLSSAFSAASAALMASLNADISPVVTNLRSFFTLAASSSITNRGSLAALASAMAVFRALSSMVPVLIAARKVVTAPFRAVTAVSTAS